MAINVSVQYKGGFLPGTMLLTQCYYQFLHVVECSCGLVKRKCILFTTDNIVTLFVFLTKSLYCIRVDALLKLLYIIINNLFHYMLKMFFFFFLCLVSLRGY